MQYRRMGAHGTPVLRGLHLHLAKLAVHLPHLQGAACLPLARLVQVLALAQVLGPHWPLQPSWHPGRRPQTQAETWP